MKNNLVILTFLSLFLLILACSNQSGNLDIPLPEITGHTPKNLNARYLASAQGKWESMLIKGKMIDFGLINEYDSLKILLNQTQWNNKIKWTEHYDKLGRLVKLESYDDGAINIYQENKYNHQGELLQEFRVEHTKNGVDTILYEYHYKYTPDSLTYLAYRTNNGDTVTRFTMKRNGKHVFKTEDAYPYRGFTYIKKQDMTLNENDKPVKILLNRISSDHEKDPLDSTLSEFKFVYNHSGQLIEEQSENDILQAKKKRYKYKNGMISEMVIDGKLVVFDQFRIAKTE